MRQTGFGQLKRFAHYDEQEDTLTRYYEQDVEPHMDMCKALRNDESYTREGVKAGAVHLCHVPNGILMQLIAKGVDVFGDPHELLRLIERDYPAFMTTTLKNNADTRQD